MRPYICWDCGKRVEGDPIEFHRKTLSPNTGEPVKLCYSCWKIERSFYMLTQLDREKRSNEQSKSNSN